MKKFMNKFYISTALTIILLLFSYAAAFSFYPDDLTAWTADCGVLDWITYFCYAGLLTALFCFRTDFKSAREKKMFALFCFFAIAALLREAGVQHWLAGTDTTAFKIRFFTNPANPPFLKAVSALCLLATGAAFAYTMYAHLIPAFKGFFSKKAGSWTIITLLSAGAMCKIFDRLPANLAKRGFPLDRSGVWFGACQIMEETLETCLPVLGILALIQFHQNKALFFPCKQAENDYL